MSSTSKRVTIALRTAAHLFHMYSYVKNRGPTWDPANMPHLIERWVKIYAESNEVPKKYWPEMVQMAQEFYTTYLKEPLERGVIGSSPVQSHQDPQLPTAPSDSKESHTP
jgi:hypothetical protein